MLIFYLQQPLYQLYSSFGYRIYSFVTLHVILVTFKYPSGVRSGIQQTYKWIPFAIIIYLHIPCFIEFFLFLIPFFLEPIPIPVSLHVRCFNPSQIIPSYINSLVAPVKSSSYIKDHGLRTYKPNPIHLLVFIHLIVCHHKRSMGFMVPKYRYLSIMCPSRYIFPLK